MNACFVNRFIQHAFSGLYIHILYQYLQKDLLFYKDFSSLLIFSRQLSTSSINIFSSTAAQRGRNPISF